MNMARVLRVVVFPEAVPPTSTTEACFSMMYRTMRPSLLLECVDAEVADGQRSLSEFRIVNVDPRL